MMTVCTCAGDRLHPRRTKPERQGEKAMSQNTLDQSHRPCQPLSEISDAELLCLVLGIRQRDRVSPLLKDGLIAENSGVNAGGSR